MKSKNKIFRLNSSIISNAENHLSICDPTIAKLIIKYGKCKIIKKGVDPFTSLVNFIIGQQLSWRAAESIINRFSRLVPKPYKPKKVFSASHQDLRKVGLSSAKIGYLYDLSSKVISGDLSLNELGSMPDDKVIEKLTIVKGVGKWTAEMFLMFTLYRPNVISLTDGSLNRAVRELYGNNYSENTEAFMCLANKWEPYKTVACWYLWRYVDG